MSKKYFKVGAHHMQWSGIDQIVGRPRGTISRIFPVLEVQTNMAGGRGFDAFVTLDQSGDTIMQQCSPGAEWVVAAARGEFVSEAEYLAQCAEESSAVETLKDAEHERLHASVRKEMAEFARRLSLEKTAMRPRPNAPGPYEDSRVIMDRIGARIAANAAGWPFDEYGVA